MRVSHRPRLVAAALLLSVAAGCDRRAELPTSTPARSAAALAPLYTVASGAIPGRYIVVLRPGESGTASNTIGQMVAASRAEVHFTYQRALQGFAATLTPEAVDQLRRDPRVAYVAEDGMSYPTTTQPNAPWGLDRIDQRALPLNGTFTYTPTGQGVRVYVIDTGIRTSHAQFGGRASVGTDLVNDGKNGQDCNGHGTHVAATIAGSTYGVAKAAQVIAVRVFACTGGAYNSTIIAAVDWVTAHAVKPAVVNMSLGGAYDPAVNQAVQNSIASGVVYAIAAGNDYAGDACQKSPASTPEAITVGATTVYDDRAVFSNIGTCVDIFAPGQDITSAWFDSDSATATISGTSMATPHVAGVAALVLQGTPTATPAAVAQKIVDSGTHNRLTYIGTGSPNLLLYSPLTVEPPVPVIALSPGSLNFTVVRTTAPGSAATAPSGLQAPTFTAGGTGTARPQGAVSGLQVATTAATASARVILSNPGTGVLEWSAASDKSWLKVDPANGALTPNYSALLNASVDAGTMAPGTYTGALTLTGAGVAGAQTLPVTMNVATAVALTPNVPLGGQSGDAGSQKFYAVEVPANASLFKVEISGGSGDADLYVRYGNPPTLNEFDCRPYVGGNYETCTASIPTAGTYYVMLRGFGSYSGVTVTATVVAIPTAPRGVVPTLVSPTSAKVTWIDGSTNETSFTLERNALTGSGGWGPWLALGTLAPNTTSFTNTGLVEGTTYVYRIRACNTVGCSAWAYTPTLVLPGITPPRTAAAVVLSSTSARITWLDASTNETGFQIIRRVLNPDGTWSAWVYAGGAAANASRFDNTGLAPGRSYQYLVRACNGTPCSNWSNTASVTTPAS